MELKDWLNSINLNKKDLFEENPDAKKEYAPFIINKCMSGHLDTVLYANEMNQSHFLDKDMQYQFYLNSVRKRKRFAPFLKSEKESDLDTVKKYYGFSNDKARSALRVLTQEQLIYMKEKLKTGGKNR